MRYGDVIHKGDVIGTIFNCREGSTVRIWIDGKEYCEDFFIKNRRDLKMCVGYWIEQIERGDIKPWLSEDN